MAKGKARAPALATLAALTAVGCTGGADDIARLRGCAGGSIGALEATQAEYPDFRAADIDHALGYAREVHGDARDWLATWVLSDRTWEMDAGKGAALWCDLADAHTDALAALRAGDRPGARSAERQSRLLFRTINLHCGLCWGATP